MKIGISAEFVGVHGGGPETYITNLIGALAQVDGDNRYRVYYSNQRVLEAARLPPNFQPRLVAPYFPWVRVPLSLPLELRRDPVDLLHAQNAVAPWVPVPFVVTIHDLAFERLPHTFPLGMRLRLQLLVRHTARRAARIITVSQNSKKDLVELYGVDPERVDVIYEAASARFQPELNAERLIEVRTRYGLEAGYLLYVGAWQPRKNVARLVEAYNILVRGFEVPHKLVIAGMRAWMSSPLLSLVRRLGLEKRVVFLGYVPEEDLPALYTGADLFAYLSAYEGFGLPPLEAMACGAPVIISNNSSLPEVVGPAGVKVDPEDIRAVVRALWEVLANPELRTQMRARGLDQAKRFSWEKAARQTLASYHKALEH